MIQSLNNSRYIYVYIVSALYYYCAINNYINNIVIIMLTQQFTISYDLYIVSTLEIIIYSDVIRNIIPPYTVCIQHYGIIIISGRGII